ncbi:nucleotidyltransferase [Shouchella miscanthi]|uniref:nucleotidyltransferase n=1 Tax=Shouchella miscanthi TaxID=2598861 RepID=UPI0011A5FA95|nr:nucleotidyltransferase [Shouchella miscanthi]
MKAVGLVVEYNPFHNGHLHHVIKAKEDSEADVVIAVMSGSFLQRGEPALVSKRVRAEMALQAGVDIVVELPYGYAVQTAPYFAEGAVRLLTALQCATLHFGSEEGDIDRFLQLNAFMKKNDHDYQQQIKAFLKKGYAYPRASAEAFAFLHEARTQLPLSEPNNILGYHYVQQIDAQASPMEPLTTLRIAANYHDEDMGEGTIASATSIRKALLHKKEVDHVLPASTARLLDYYKQTHGHVHFWENYYSYLKYQILTRTPAELEQIAECEEGLEYRLIETGLQATSFSDWLTRLKTKRYTKTRLQRLFVHLLTNTTKEEMATVRSNRENDYIRLLGMSETGKSYLNQYKKAFSLPVVTREAELRHYGALASLDQRATACYWLTKPGALHSEAMKQEFQATPLFLKNS